MKYQLRFLLEIITSLLHSSHQIIKSSTLETKIHFIPEPKSPDLFPKRRHSQLATRALIKHTSPQLKKYLPQRPYNLTTPTPPSHIPQKPPASPSRSDRSPPELSREQTLCRRGERGARTKCKSAAQTLARAPGEYTRGGGGANEFALTITRYRKSQIKLLSREIYGAGASARTWGPSSPK